MLKLLGAVLLGCGWGVWCGQVWATEPVVVTQLYSPGKMDEPNRNRMLADLKKETGIELQYKAVSGDGDTTQRLQIMAGETQDIIYLTNTNNQEIFTSEGLILPLEAMAANDKVDLKATFGNYLRPRNGHVYYLPAEISMQVVFYNKALFDKAGVAYPKPGWTWADYVAIAKKLNKPSQKVWGSLMQNWEYFQYMGAHLRGVPDYSADGQPNFQHPAFKEALKWFGDLGNVHKIQPSWKAMSLGAATWNSMMTGNFGMTYIGSWHLVLFGDRVNNPRDWKFGIAPPPVFPGYKNALVAGAAYAVSKNTRHPQEAFRVAAWLSKNAYKYLGGLPALASLSRENFRAYFQEFCDTRFKGDITVDDLYAATLGNGLNVVPEKITGEAGPEINAMYLTEAEKYLVGWQSLDDTMATIQKKATEIVARNVQK